MGSIPVTWNGVEYTCTVTVAPDAWAFPVGEQGYPPERWYCATWHDPTGVLNGGYRHTGIDLNLDVSPWGDIERTLGLHVTALTDGVVYHVSPDWYGAPMLVCQHMHAGAILYVRYGHIVPAVKLGDVVHAGTVLGAFADWKTGDHLHLDMTTTELRDAWFTSGMLDPVDVLKAHLDPARVDAMLERG